MLSHMMVVDGKRIAVELKAALRTRLSTQKRELSLGVLVVHETPEIRQFVALKERCGTEVGVRVDVVRTSPVAQSTQDVLRELLHLSQRHDGVIVQLPLPKTVDMDAVLRLIPFSHDVDVLGMVAYEQFARGALPFLPPVIGAFAEVLRREHVALAGARVLVVGEGRLVGAPAAVWARHGGAVVTVVNNETSDLTVHTRDADIIVLGAGSPGILKPDMVQQGCVILDAGTSEEGGVLKGDADPACAERARVFTPTPGGIGPITVVKVFENLSALAELKERRAGRVDAP